MKPLTADNADGRTLLALRAGPMTAGELSARNGTGVAGWLIRAGYVVLDGRYYRITEAGRSACPLRNPLARSVQPQFHQPETNMSRDKQITRQQVLATITAASQAGISRKQLIEHFDGQAQSIDNHINALYRDTQIFKPRLGHLVDTQFKPPASLPQGLATLAAPRQEEAAPCVQQNVKIETKTDLSLADEAQGTANNVLTGGELNSTSQRQVDELSDLINSRLPVIVEDILLADPDEVEFAIFSSGGLDIYSAETTVSLNKAVLGKLRAFLGIFQQEVA